MTALAIRERNQIVFGDDTYNFLPKRIKPRRKRPKKLMNLPLSIEMGLFGMKKLSPVCQYQGGRYA
jgi:hypothetical protein